MGVVEQFPCSGWRVNLLNLGRDSLERGEKKEIQVCRIMNGLETVNGEFTSSHSTRTQAPFTFSICY